MPFPILCTPFIVQSEIISILQPNEIVTASFCSKKVERLLKGHYQRRKPLEWRLFMTDRDSSADVIIETSKDDREGIPVIAAEDFSELDKSIHIPRESDRYEITFHTERSLPVIYFKDRVMAAKWVVEYVTDLFNLDIYGIEIDNEGIWAIDWINGQDKMLKCFDWNGDEATMDYVLRNTRASEQYTLAGTVSDNYRFEGKLVPGNHFLIYSDGHWVTLDNLMNFDFASIVVTGCRLSVPDLYAFIGHWLNGGSPRLTFLRLHFDNQLDFEHFEDQLEVVERDIAGEYRVWGWYRS
ncbi:hypothetical protein B9Z55_015758 [Caenorhabditis nigoni]|uniref:Sdz-33 F-box domain-containing protein n=1 Tax=Caenorhabditis nigoni TaxID=1611254 RepID=A0A2G5UBR1_9PELO|nr:hypothetical protein B9Z55_015758 [Caenorhabditis nigoni]